MPKISVIMPVYNGAQYLAESIESILNQTERDFEFLILNEFGSNDGSAEIIKQYVQQDKRIKYIQATERLGPTRSRNLLFREAQGEYIALMDCDDISAPRRLEIQLLYFSLYKDIGAIGIKHRVIPAENFLVRYHSDWRIAKTSSIFFTPIRHPTKMIQRDLINQYQLFYDEALEGLEDFELQYRIAHHTKIMNINDPSLFTYSWYSNNSSNVFKDRDNQLRQHITKRNVQDSFHIELSDRDAQLLSFTIGIKKNPENERLNALRRIEYLLKLLFNLNLERQGYEPYALSFTLFERWTMEMHNIRALYGSLRKAPQELRTFYENSSFFKLNTYTRFEIDGSTYQ